MNISSAASTFLTAQTTVPKQTREVVEGTQPDGDGDRDDAVNSAIETQKTTVATGSMGSQLDVTA